MVEDRGVLDAAEHAWMRQLEHESDRAIGFSQSYGKEFGCRVHYWIAYVEADDGDTAEEGKSRNGWLDALDNLAIALGLRTEDEIAALRDTDEAFLEAAE